MTRRKRWKNASPKAGLKVSVLLPTLFNLNYGVEVGKTGKKENRKAGKQESNLLPWIAVLPYKHPTLTKIQALFDSFGSEVAFGRSDVMQVTGLTGSPASALLTKMCEAGVGDRLAGAEYGKYRFNAER